jgi:hypothetical protein
VQASERFLPSLTGMNRPLQLWEWKRVGFDRTGEVEALVGAVLVLGYPFERECQ